MMTDDLKWIEREKRFEYMTSEESDLYLSVRDSSDPKDGLIKQLLERIAKQSRSMHRATTY